MDLENIVEDLDRETITKTARLQHRFSEPHGREGASSERYRLRETV